MGLSRKPYRERLPRDRLAFLYVPYTFLYVPPCFLKDFLGKLYVPIRSVQPFRRNMKMLYVPIRSYCVPIRSAMFF